MLITNGVSINNNVTVENPHRDTLSLQRDVDNNNRTYLTNIAAFNDLLTDHLLIDALLPPANDGNDDIDDSDTDTRP